MRAVLAREFGNFESARVEECADPVLGDVDVLVEIHAAPVNYVDLLIFRGEYQFVPELPYVPGKGPAGIVRRVGAAVTDVAPGDRVLAMAEAGGYAELVAVNHQQVHHLPEGMPFTDAAAMSLAYDTAWFALRERARFEPGDSVLVLGASGAVGQAAVQLAHAMGARRVLAGASGPGRPVGPADAVIDLSQPDLRNSVRQQVLDATAGDGVDIVIDPLGGDAFDGAVRALAWRGRLVIVGFAAGRIPTLKMNYPMLKNIEISGLQISDYRKRIPSLVKECYREVFAMWAHGDLKPPDSTVFPLAEWRTALEDIGSVPAGVRRLLVPRIDCTR